MRRKTIFSRCPMARVLYFSNSDAEYGNEVWRYSAATHTFDRLSDINPQGGCANPRYFALLNNDLFFVATDDSTGYEPYVIRNITVGTIDMHEAAQAQKLLVFPNPVSANSRITVLLDTPQTISLVDMRGSIITTQHLDAGSASFVLPNLPQGVYYLQTRTGIAKIVVM